MASAADGTMIHYHGTPMTPDSAAADILRGRHAMVSYAHPEQIELVAEVCQSFALDNGAFTEWKRQRPLDLVGFYGWVETWRTHPGCDWALIPDTIDGGEAENDALLADWPFGVSVGVPVWHLHESLERLARLAEQFPRVALGSSGAYVNPGERAWWARMHEAMNAVSVRGRPRVKLHGLRMLDAELFTALPLASADSTNVARSIGIDSRWRGTYAPPTKAARGLVIAARIEAQQSAAAWDGWMPRQERLLG